MLCISDDDFIRLSCFIQKNYGINLSKKKHLVEGRLHDAVIKKGFSDFSEYIDCVMCDKYETDQLLNKLTTNHTYFMRESAHFDFFKNTILPALEKKKKNKVLAI